MEQEQLIGSFNVPTPKRTQLRNFIHSKKRKKKIKKSKKSKKSVKKITSFKPETIQLDLTAIAKSSKSKKISNLRNLDLPFDQIDKM